MTRAKQLEANRQTAEAKAKPANNSLFRELDGKPMFLPEEEPALFFQLKRDLFKELQPVTEVEHIVFNRIVQASWRGNRVLSLEIELLAQRRAEMKENNNWCSDEYERRLATLARYETSINRGFERDLKLLKALRKERLKEEALAVKEAPLAVKEEPSEEQTPEVEPVTSSKQTLEEKAQTVAEALASAFANAPVTPQSKRQLKKLDRLLRKANRSAEESNRRPEPLTANIGFVS